MIIKKTIWFGLVMVLMLNSVLFADVNYGVGGSVGTYSIASSMPVFAVNGGSWDVLLGYKSLGTGDHSTLQTSYLVGGAWYVFRNNASTIFAGPSLYYYSEGVNNGGDIKAPDYTVTHTIIGFTAKSALVRSVDLRADVLLSDTVGGKMAGENVSGYNKVLSTFQLSIMFYPDFADFSM